jgi:hypothetical protein
MISMVSGNEMIIFYVGLGIAVVVGVVYGLITK